MKLNFYLVKLNVCQVTFINDHVSITADRSCDKIDHVVLKFVQISLTFYYLTFFKEWPRDLKLSPSDRRSYVILDFYYDYDLDLWPN